MNNGECETVQFWVTVNEKEKVHLFDIIFAGGGYKIGIIQVNESKNIEVGIESYSYNLDDSWTEDEVEILSSIEHDINYLLENMSKLEGFIAI